jgi:hypothetical protein
MSRVTGCAIALSMLAGQFLCPSGHARTLTADPSAGSGQPNYYRTLAGSLTPGDTLILPSGVYPDRLNLEGLQGAPSAWVVVLGPDSGPPARITTASTCCNTVQLGGTAYVALKNLTIDSAGIDAIDGINAKGNPTHDIVIENCTVVGQGSHQQTVGISTKSAAWNWVIRANRILEAGTGIYLGNSDGTEPFIAGVIEGNLIMNTIGYNMQIKHQLPYGTQSWVSQLPPEPHRTIIRDNVFIKERNDWLPSQVDGPRPNLLVDPFPGSGVGSSDLYEIYGNFFYRNPNESLFQGTGRISMHDNIFVGSAAGQASALFTDHNGPLRLAHVFNNTVYSTTGAGIYFSSSARDGDAVVGNLILSQGAAVGGAVGNAIENLIGPVADASRYFVLPSETLGSMDFYPKVDCPGCSGTPLNLTAFQAETAFDRDFNGDPKTGFVFRGAYAGAGVNPGWRLQADRKMSGAGSADNVPPNPPSDLRSR